MAKSNVKKKMAPVVEMPECPVCLETMSSPIFQCQSGHSLCNSCTKNLLPPNCPICRQPMTQVRNWQLEDLISKATANCPNQFMGCKYTTVAANMENHVKECIFREMSCPLSVFGKCSWSGKLKEMLDHFKDRHPQNLVKAMNEEVTINNVSITEDDRFMYIMPQGKMMFILTLKIDINLKVAYGVVQLIGCMKVAQQHVYELTITSLQDRKRKVTYYDHCYTDAMPTNEIFREAKCCLIPLGMMATFMDKKSLAFSLNVQRIQPYFNKAQNKGQQQDHPNTRPNVNKNPKYRGKSPSAVAHGPKGPWKKNENKKN